MKIAVLNHLAGLPGDYIVFKSDNGISCEEKIRNTLWVETPKGGKIWSYETENGNIVPNTNVETITRDSIECDDKTNIVSGGFDTKLQFYKSLDKLDISSILKTIISLILDDSIKSLEVASFLLNSRIKQLGELNSHLNNDL